MALNGGKSARYTAVLVFYVQAQGLVERLLPSREEESTIIMYGEGRKKVFFIMCGRKLPMSMQLMLDFIWGLLSTIMDRIFPQNPNSPIPLRSTPGTTNSKNSE